MPIKLPSVQVTEHVETKKLPGELVSPDHDLLYARIEEYAQQANIDKAWIWGDAKALLSDKEYEWAMNFPAHKGVKHGLVVWGGLDDVDDRFCAMCGLLTRNFLWGKMLTLLQFIEAVEDSDIIAPSCVFVPNFYAVKSKVPDWQLHMLLDGLKQRGNMGKQTVLYVDDPKGLEASYGSTLVKYLHNQFHSLEF